MGYLYFDVSLAIKCCISKLKLLTFKKLESIQYMCVAYVSTHVCGVSVYVFAYVCSAHAHVHTGGGQRESKVQLYFSLFPLIL